MDIFNILVLRLHEMATEFVRLLPQLAIACLVLILTWAAARLAKNGAGRLATRARLRPSLVSLCRTLATLVIWVLGTLIALTVILPGVTPASLLAVLGLGSVAVGFAFKDIFENFLAGVLIMLRKKMRIGDMVESEGVEGVVEHITLRETHLRLLSNELTIVPNAHLFKNPVKIFTDAEARRYEIVVGIAYDADLDTAGKVIEQAVRSADGVDSDKHIDVFAREFNSSSIDFTVRWWAGSKPLDMHRSRDAVVRAIKRALDEAGIEIPFPQVTNSFKGPIRIERDIA